jgi:hypothetical protein
MIGDLLVGLTKGPVGLHTTMYWYYRAWRDAVLGAGGHLSGPFEQLDTIEQQRVVLSLLELRETLRSPIRA